MNIPIHGSELPWASSGRNAFEELLVLLQWVLDIRLDETSIGIKATIYLGMQGICHKTVQKINGMTYY